MQLTRSSRIVRATAAATPQRLWIALRSVGFEQSAKLHSESRLEIMQNSKRMCEMRKVAKSIGVVLARHPEKGLAPLLARDIKAFDAAMRAHDDARRARLDAVYGPIKL
jgi:hypothetical protein